jgi:amidase
MPRPLPLRYTAAMRSAASRREFITGAAAAAAAGLLARAATAAADKAGPGGAGELAYKSAADLLKALAARRVSSVELTDSAIARITALDKPINAVVVRGFDRARAAAKAADAALARGETRPLLGLPITVKEQFNVAGLPTTWGNPRFAGWEPGFDSLAVARLKGAGAIILGKTNVPLMLEDWQSYNDIYGTTNNPWDPARTPGGSSGGSAAALAAGFTALELGSDIGGSLRCPAHFCGVFAHKPSLDLVPLRGALPPKVPPLPVKGGLAVAGPMARSAADLALELEIIAGPDEMTEGKGYRLALPPARHRELRDFRVLLVDAHPLCPTAANVRAALDRLADQIGKAGGRVERASPLLPDLAETARIYVAMLAAGNAANLSAEAYQHVEAAAKSLAPDDDSLAAARQRGLAFSHRDWIQTARASARLGQSWRELFKAFDVLLCPPMPTPAFPHDHEKDERARRIDIDGVKVPYTRQIVWASIATLFGLPATVAPIGKSGEGLPLGVQIVGPYLEDRTTIAFATAIEREFGGFVPPPSRS